MGVMLSRGEVSADAPGSMILMGEYAVLEGAPAVLMTLKFRLAAVIAPSDVFKVESDRFDSYAADGVDAAPPHAVLIQNILSCCGLDPAALRVRLSSDIPHTYGFGSSAALVAAVVRAAFRLQKKTEDFAPMFEAGRAAILRTHGRGSGADLAASLCDAPFVLFDPTVPSAEAFQMPFAVQAIYTGYKTPTPEVLRRVRAQVPDELWRSVLAEMAACARDFVRAPNFSDVQKYQVLMEKLDVQCDKGREAVRSLTGAGAVAKISGSGLGDCVVGFSPQSLTLEVPPPLEFFHARDLQ